MIDPILKQDLNLIRSHFENEAMKQDSTNVAYVPVSASLRGQKLVHQSIQSAAKTYPSYYARNEDKNKSLVDKIQNECIPCLARIKQLIDCDMDSTWSDILSNFNSSIQNGLLGLFKAMEGKTDAERYACDLYLAMKDQCVPDLARAIAALTFLLADLKGIEIPKLKDIFISIVLQLVGSYLINSAFGLDKYAALITNTLKCVSDDLKFQLSKLEPILTKEGQIKAGQQVASAVSSKWTQDKSPYIELPPNQPIYDKIDRATAKANNAVVGASTLIEGTIDEAIKRIDYYLFGAQQDLLKLFKGNADNLNALAAMVEKVLTVKAIIGLLQSLLGSKRDLNPCGSDVDRARRFFSRINLPDRDIVIQPINPDDPLTNPNTDPNDVDIIIIPKQITVNNPIVKSVLESNGIEFINTDDGKTVIKQPSTVINLFGCLGRTSEEE